MVEAGNISDLHLGFQKDAAKADRKHAVQTVKDQGIERGHLAPRTSRLSLCSAFADEAYAVEQARILKIQRTDDATAQCTFHNLAAGAFVVLIGQWHQVVYTRWSEYQLNLRWPSRFGPMPRAMRNSITSMP